MLSELIGCGQPLPPEEAGAPAGGVSFEQLEEHHCRWPYGDPSRAGFHFCGEAKLPGLSWCLGHAKRAFDPPKVQAKTGGKQTPLVRALMKEMA